LGFQAPFSLQSNPAAARAAALWQKLIRRGAGIRLGSERAVTDVYGTFIDPAMGSCGEIVEWIDGRNWRFEADDRLDLRRLYLRGLDVPAEQLGSREYLAKRRFMADVVDLLHQMGAAELALQYEWWTCKSQPNCLKRLDAGPDPSDGLTAVDFRAGLALLAFLPMSPGDVALILDGLARGSLVQFDRGDLGKLERFIDRFRDDFADLRGVIDELRWVESAYRRSQLDLTHNAAAPMRDRRLWSDILDATITSWQVRNITDGQTAGRFRRHKSWAILFALVGLVPLLGRFVRRLWGRTDYRRHWAAALSSASYLRRALRAKIAESLIRWLRTDRVSDRRAELLIEHPWLWYLNLPLSVLPAKLHRILTDWRYAAGVAAYLFVRPVRLFFNAQARRQWLVQMIAEGRRDGMLTDDEARHIEQRIDEPFIQKYLQSLAVHVCTLPVTQVVSVAVAFWYKAAHHLTWAQAWKEMLGILVLFQLTPISPGSLVRGLYVVYLVIRERNFRDYNIAVFLGFFKYIGYLAFPVQMAYRYPSLARFMAGRWATGAVHFVPVFGERGALMEHGVFDLFYNRTLTLRRRLRLRYEALRPLPVRSWHVWGCAAVGIAALAGLDGALVLGRMKVSSLPGSWYLAIWPPLLAAYAASLWSGGAAMGRRLVNGVVCGALIGLGYSVTHAAMGCYLAGSSEAFFADTPLTHYVAASLMRGFVLGLIGLLGAALEACSTSDVRAAESA